MNEDNVRKIARELNLGNANIMAAAALLEEGATVPFIARYRKEATGSLDEVVIATIRDRLLQIAEMDKRRNAILKSLVERNILTEELKAKITSADNMTVLEDVYLPYRLKRRTKATIAKENGLDRLATLIINQDIRNPTEPFKEAHNFINKEKNINTPEEALAGARDIIAEIISEDTHARTLMRRLFSKECTINSKLTGVEAEGIKYKDYYKWEEPAATAPSHRIMAMMRGEKEKHLKIKVMPPEDKALNILYKLFIKGNIPASEQVKLAVQDSYKRLLGPSLETEIRGKLKKKADEDAIKVFGNNLRELLLAPPLGQKTILAIDPGFRTGCKVVCLDRQGNILHNETIYPHSGNTQAVNAKKMLLSMCKRFKIEAIAIGNGTAGRETESFVRKMDLSGDISVIMVNESGASIYSASEVAREEFPDHDITVRGAVSIGRRLADPLAELVKIDPKSIGVGQYQHDVDQGALKKSLDDIVMSCVNNVGVDVNTASKSLLTYVSGLGSKLAKNIINYRTENGPFKKREELKKVKLLGKKAFEQAGGFLRICNGANPLDNSAVHPESYYIASAISSDMGCSVGDIIGNERSLSDIKLENYVSESVGMPTLRDIVTELTKPGRDPRDKFEVFSFAEGIDSLENLEIGMELPGIVTNVTAFGAFVDVGVHQDGLIHISHMADRFVKDPGEVLKVQQIVSATVIGVDIQRKRISLSLKSEPFTKGTL